MKYKYYSAVNDTMFYRVCENPKICQYFVVGSPNRFCWQNSCYDHITYSTLFVRVSRDVVRKKNPKLFR